MARLKTKATIKVKIKDIVLDYSQQNIKISVEFDILGQIFHKAYLIQKKEDVYNFEDFKYFVEKEAREMISLNRFGSELLKRKGTKFNIDI